MRTGVAALIATGFAGAAWAEPPVEAARYQCERGVEVQVVFVNAKEGSVAVLDIEGRLITLFAMPSASGVRYAWPSDGSGYVLLTKGDQATILWHDPNKADDVPVYAQCVEGD